MWAAGHKATGAETAGSFSLSEAAVSRGACAPLHTLLRTRIWHRQAEDRTLLRSAKCNRGFLPCPRNVVVEKLLDPRCEAVQG